VAHPATEREGTPEQRFRERESPSARARRTRVLLIRRSPRLQVAVGSVANPSRAPIARTMSALPSRARPNLKSSPRISEATPRPRTMTLSMKASACMRRSVSSKRRHRRRSTPASASSSIFSRSVVRRAGASSRCRYSRGSGSKVTSVLGRPCASACSRSCASTARCPRCTPSNAPIVATQGRWRERRPRRPRMSSMISDRAGLSSRAVYPRKQARPTRGPHSPPGTRGARRS
jgi:hypothetical protein